MNFLPILFFLTALIYASVGFGGGSTYTSLLVLFNLDYQSIPIISLSCNLIVVSVSSFYFVKNKLVNTKLIISLIVFSIPMSFLGGNLKLSEEYFVLILGLALLGSSLLMLSNKSLEADEKHAPTNRKSYWQIGFTLGLPVGLIAGITGIGGGIFLAPILHLMNIAKARTIAATACLFILVNSLAGLMGQLNKQGLEILHFEHLKILVLLPISVLIGGLIGNRVAIKYFTPLQLRRATAILILVVAIRLLFRWFSY